MVCLIPTRRTNLRLAPAAKVPNKLRIRPSEKAREFSFLLCESTRYFQHRQESCRLVFLWARPHIGNLKRRPCRILTVPAQTAFLPRTVLINACVVVKHVR